MISRNWLLRALLGLMLTTLITACGTTQEGPRMARAPLPVVEALPDAQQAQLAQVRQHLAAENTAAAAALLTTLRETHPEHPRVLAAEGTLARLEGRRDEAEDKLQHALKLQPDNSHAANDLALLLVEQGRFTETESLLRQGLEYHPDNPRLHYNLGILYEQYLLDLRAALRHYQRYQAMAPDEDQQVAMWIADLERRVN